MKPPDYEVDFYIARGRSLERLLAFRERVSAHQELWWKVGQELGANQLWCSGVSGTEAFGWDFPEGSTPPDSVRTTKKHPNMWAPNPRTASGKALLARLAACPPEKRTFTSTLFEGVEGSREVAGGFVVGRGERGGFIVVGVSFEKLGDDWILWVPRSEEGSPSPTPPDAEPLKKSDYWLRREALEATQQPAAEGA